ncbi:YybH family protein [Nesterenkonia ebinurensis]|uniref:YybH family protein n=1 Tax=Nesterenkonia ebinurensis TaxID=2608252 RepID=UPI00123DBD3B|nr:nuclear transport factor 2 family protein [Nesterenkonia ebinurensis]
MPESSVQTVLDALLTATNTHDFDNVAELLSEDVIYYFGDATLVGREAVRHYFERTWDTIRDERYWAEDIHWPVNSADAAVAVYRYQWRGTIEGRQAEGSGRATNAFVRTAEGVWLLAHEHLSAAA